MVDDFAPCGDCLHKKCCGFKDAYKEFLDGPAKKMFDDMPAFLEAEIHCKHRKIETANFWPNSVRYSQ